MEGTTMAAWHRGLVGALLLLALAQVAGISSGLNRWLTDAHWRWRATGQPTPFPSNILVIGIDDKTVQKFGRLRYWSRARYAQLLERLKLAKAVGIDILFTEPDDRDPQGDATLSQAMRAHGKVVLPLHHWKEARPFSSAEQAQAQALLEKLPRAQTSLAGQLPVAFSHSLQPPIDALRETVSGIGYADVNADTDGVFRTPLLLKVTNDGVILPHLSVSIACIAQGTSLADAVRDASAQLRLGQRTVPLLDGALMLQPIARRGGGYGSGIGQPVPTVSFVDALTMSPQKFADKIVLVGETATGTSDVRPNPLDNSLRGVELNAEILANLLHLPPVRPLPTSVQWLLIAAAVGVPLWLYVTLAPRAATMGAGVALLVTVGVMETGFWAGRIVPSWSAALLGFFGSTLLMGLQRLAQEEAAKRQLRQSFSVYVAPELVEKIVVNPQVIHQEGTRQRVAILFSDVRNFTPYSEQNPPELVVRQMQEYLSEMTESVDTHQGALDKFMGDAVMALFNPFIPNLPNASGLAVSCALDMLERLERLNRQWAQQSMPPFRIGIGIHVGDAIVGNIGSFRRMQYTALGDAVNLAARLQTATKELSAALIVSDAVKAEAEPLLRDAAEFIFRGAIAVKGREQPVEVYEVRRRG
jgi:adenylate cyclase